MAVTSPTIDELLDAGRIAWPSLDVNPGVFAEHVRRLHPGLELSKVEGSDLYLAAACAAGDPAAIEIFEAEMLPVVRREARRIDASPHFVDEVSQTMRDRLLVGTPPRIADYSGRGPLRAWVRISSVRSAMNMLRPRQKVDLVDGEGFDRVAAAFAGTEMEHLQQRYRAACTEALRSGFEALTPRDRNLLRLHYLDGLTVDELAPTHKVHRSTVARWIGRARDHIFDQAKQRLAETIGGSPSQLESLLGALRSQLDVSIERLLVETST